MHRKVHTGKVELTSVLQMGYLGTEHCGASLRLLHIGRVELTRVLEMGHLNVKNTKEKPHWQIGAHESSRDGTPQCQKCIGKSTPQGWPDLPKELP